MFKGIPTYKRHPVPQGISKKWSSVTVNEKRQSMIIPRGGGGGHSGTQHVRDFVKEGYFLVPRYEVWGSKSPYNPRNIRSSDAE